MGLIVLAVFAILLGAAIRSFGPTVARPGAAGAARLVGYGFMAVGLLLAFANTFVVIDVGEVGVKHFLGTVDPDPLEQGVHVVNPLASIEKMSVREQSFPPGGGVERIEAQTSEQLNVMIEVSALFRLDGTNAPELYARLGTEERFQTEIIQERALQQVEEAKAERTIGARDLEALEREIERAKERFGVPLEGRVVSCYEAGQTASGCTGTC